MSQIQRVRGWEILDSRGQPTVEAEVVLKSGSFGRAAVPSGASTGSKEALELRDGEAARYFGKGVRRAVAAINGDIARALEFVDASDQEKLDALLCELDGTPNRARLGANAILAVSLAAAKAAASEQGIPLYQYIGGEQTMHLPVPMMNVINGGAHADNNLDIQEFMILPIGAPTFAEALRYGAEVFGHLRQLLRENGLATGVGDEGGFAPNLSGNASALDFIMQAIERAGYVAGEDIFLGLDVAANELYRDGHYHLASEKKTFSAEAFTAYFSELVDRYPIISIEDGMAENDLAGWKLLTAKLGQRIQLVGDDVFVTNTTLLQKGIQEAIANALLVKPNQIGTLTETLAAIRMARAAGYNTILSHRSGETEDTTIADLAVGTNACQIKTGSLCRSDRVAKYNRLLHIAAERAEKSTYAGALAFRHFACFERVSN